MSDFLAEKITEPGVFDPPSDLATRENWAKAFEIAKLHADVFNNDAGRTLIRHWVKAMMVRPIVRPNQDAYSHGIREGQADFVRQVLTQLEIARIGPGGPPQ